MILASFFNFAISSSTLSTKMPPALSGGFSTFSIFRRGSTLMPKSAKLIVSTGFFLALMMFYTLAKRGVFSLRSQENMAGKDTYIFCRPKSTSLVTVASLSPISSLEAKVAAG